MHLATLPLAALVLVACGGEAPAPAANPGPAPPADALPRATAIPPEIDEGLELPADAKPLSFDYVELIVEGASADVRIGALVADTIERRTRGLMYRAMLPTDTGMLFAFPLETNSPFWNRDTPLDLEIALLDGEGTILEILALAAQDATLVSPLALYLYAVEMPAGWWARQNAGPGDRVHIPAGVIGLAE